MAAVWEVEDTQRQLHLDQWHPALVGLLDRMDSVVALEEASMVAAAGVDSVVALTAVMVGAVVLDMEVEVVVGRTAMVLRL